MARRLAAVDMAATAVAVAVVAEGECPVFVIVSMCRVIAAVPTTTPLVSSPASNPL